MALVFPAGPENAVALIQGPLAHAVGTRVGGDPLAGGAESFRAALPHEVWSAGLEDVASGRLLSAAKRQGWRYVLVNGKEPVASATLQLADGGENARFSHLTEGRFVKATVDAINLANAMPRVAGADYELRFLDVPALHLRAVWLHAQGDDWLIPLALAPAELDPNRAYTEAEIVSCFTDTATKLRAASAAEEIGG